MRISHFKWSPVLLTLWGCSPVAGGAALWNYSPAPGLEKAAAETWPAAVSFKPGVGRAALVMVAHPRCPCTRSSLAELERLMARGEADALVVFVMPEGADEGWEHTALVERARTIPGVRLVMDRDGAVAESFGAMISGHTVFYDEKGVRRYSGGLTLARGREGLGKGGDAVLSLLPGRAGGIARDSVFGCELPYSDNR